MNASKRASRCWRRQGGFALLLVLLVLVLLAAIGIRVTSTGRNEAQIARNLVGSAQAEAIADAGVARAVFGIIDPDAEKQWAIDGQPHIVKVADGTATVTVRDESGKINPNLAPEGLIFALVQAVGVDQERARSLAAAIADWVSPPAAARPYGAKAAEYGNAGLAYVPPNAPVESVDELVHVLGMTPNAFQALRPNFSVFSTVQVPAAANATPAVRRALEIYQAGIASQGGSQRLAVRPLKPTVAVESMARTSTGSVFMREAVLRVDPQIPKGYVVLAWGRGDLPER